MGICAAQVSLIKKIQTRPLFSKSGSVCVNWEKITSPTCKSQVMLVIVATRILLVKWGKLDLEIIWGNRQGATALFPGFWFKHSWSFSRTAAKILAWEQECLWVTNTTPQARPEVPGVAEEINLLLSPYKPCYPLLLPYTDWHPVLLCLVCWFFMPQGYISYLLLPAPRSRNG